MVSFLFWLDVENNFGKLDSIYVCTVVLYLRRWTREVGVC